MDSYLCYRGDIRTTGLVGHWKSAISKSLCYDYWAIRHRQNPGYRCHVRHYPSNPGVLHITNFYEDRVVGRLLVRVKAQTTIRGAGK